MRQQELTDYRLAGHGVIGPFSRRWLVSVGSETEQELIAAARRFDRAAFDRLVSTYRNRLCAFLTKRVGREAMDDVLQDTLLAAWQSISTLQTQSRFVTWLFGIAVHKAADHRGMQGRRSSREVSVDTPLLEVLGGSANETARFEHREMALYLLNHLTADRRQLLEMYYFEGLTLLEIATILNRNLNAVKYHFYCAHTQAARHREVLGEEPIRFFTRRSEVSHA